MQKALIFGATGYIGNNLVRYLNSLKEFDIRIFRRHSSPLENLSDCTYEQYTGDLLNKKDLAMAIKGCSGIFNLAAETNLLVRAKEAREAVNVRFVELLTATILKDNPQARLLHCSSVGAIGISRNPETIIDENHLFDASNIHYFFTKHKAEGIVCAAQARGLNAVIVNPATVIGGRGMNGIQLETIKRVLAGKLKYYPSGGSCFSFADDVVRGIYLAYTAGKAGQRYILSGHNLSFKEYFEKIACFVRQRPPYIRLPGMVLSAMGQMLELFGSPVGKDAALLSVLYGYYSSAKAMQELGYEITPFEVGMTKILRQITPFRG